MPGRICKAAICFSGTSAKAESLCRQAEADIGSDSQTYTDREYEALIKAAEEFDAAVMRVVDPPA